MKTIGLIGGTSWTSTIEYYRYINEEIAQRLGGLHSAKLVLTSLDFAELEAAMHAGHWDSAANILEKEALRLRSAGVDVILLCSNLIHKLYDKVQAISPVPLLHIADALADEITRRQYKTVALLGTKPIMEESFYIQRIEEKADAKVITPTREDRDYIDAAIFDRMCRNLYTDKDRAAFVAIIEKLREKGAESIILGCTELPVLLQNEDLPLLNSTHIHSKKAVEWALSL